MKALRVVAVFTLFLVSGCGVAINANRSAEGYKPVLYLDPKPKLWELSKEEYAEFNKLSDPVRKKIEENVKALSIDSIKCRKVVEKYNIWAGTSNEMTAKNLGLRGGKDDDDRKADVIGPGDERDGRRRLDF